MIVASQEAVKHQSLVGIPSGIYGKYLNVVIVASQEAVTNQSLLGILSGILLSILMLSLWRVRKR